LTPRSSDDDEGSTGAKPLDPCMLVSRAQAQRAAGGHISKSVEAPLGPTCIYEFRGAMPDVTLAVQSQSFVGATRALHRPRRLNVRGRPAYCGTLGKTMLVVSIGTGRTLNVTAPCDVARRMANLAVGRLRT
jgi:hypothetical protein